MIGIGIDLSLTGGSAGGGSSGVPSLDLNFTSGTMPTEVTFTRSSTAWAYNSSGVLTSYATNTPRFDYNPLTLAAKGLLIEEQRINLMPGTMTGGTFWQGAATTITSGATAPDGTTNAYTLTQTAGGTISYGASPLVGVFGTITASTPTTASIFAKAGTCSFLRMFLTDSNTPTISSVVWFNLAAGTIGTTSNGGSPTSTSSTMTSVGNGWYRCTITATLGSATTATILIRMASADASTTDTGSKAFSVFNPQLEAGAFATSPILTTTAAATRAADLASVTSLGSWFNAAEGTVLTEFALNAVQTQNAQTVLSIDDATANERYTLRCAATTGLIGLAVADGGVTQALTTHTAPAVTVTNKFAAAYALDNFAGCLNGATVSTDTSGTLPTVTRMTIGNRATAEHLNGYVRRVRVYRSKLGNVELQNITT